MSKPVHYYGYHACKETIQQRPEDVLQLFVLNNKDDDRISELLELAGKFGVSVQSTKKINLENLVDSQQHQGIVIQCREIPTLTEKDLENLLMDHATRSELPALFLALDQITDPHNLGACLRSAAAMGVTAVISSKRNSCSLTATAVKVAAGAAELVPFVSVGGFSNALKKLQELDVLIVGTMLDDSAINIQECNFTKPAVIVMGSEDTGLRNNTKEVCDQLAYLPMYGDIQSLNVSVATGMSLYEARRQVQIK